MIDNWEYFVIFGSILAGITGAINFLIARDTPYTQKLDQIRVDIRVNYLEQLTRAIIAKHGANEQGITDADINAELRRIFLMSERFTKCENLDNNTKNSITQLVCLIVAIGIAIAGYPYVLTLPESPILLYNSTLITLIFFVVIVLFCRQKNKKKLVGEIANLETRICVDRGLIEEKDNHA